MSNPDAPATKSGSPALGLFSKLMLWVLVILFGIFYLSSIKRRAEAPPAPIVGAPTSVPAATSQTAGGPVKSAEPAGSVGQAVATPVPGSDPGAVSAAPPAQAPAPVQAAESAAFANSLVSERPAATPPEATSPGPTASIGPTEVATVPPPAALALPQGLASGRLLQPGSVDVALEERRRQIMAEYEAMRRSAQEGMRQRWDPMGTVPMPPFGVPAHPPVYGPGGFVPR
jgi:hypothetical protein